ncbi:MAG: tRNA pseudouridine(38-40) synthase TruA [Gemmatimonadetes bacterium]|nr:tRNA pseudouridine(38-40) synthase TruA [Gemmatimonadota bacterium]NIO31158.1 tRNA pseudouridine(38-40) synthase TruA [Gemmatimonadota bacterium]
MHAGDDTTHWRVKLVLHYDGRDFYGWQTQTNRRTVQGELSALLGRLCGVDAVSVTAAGRTDRGVHATGQVASALIPNRFDERELVRALNALAPSDLWIESAEPVPESFHPRYDALSRTYVYRVGLSPGSRSPFEHRWCWPVGHSLDRERIDAAASCIAGEHDFGAFAKSGQPERGVRCNVSSAFWREAARDAGILEFEITADRFLHHMVRYLVGTLVATGRGLRPVDHVGRLLEGEPGLKAAPPAPAQGLFLARVDYTSGQTEAKARGKGESE